MHNQKKGGGGLRHVHSPKKKGGGVLYTGTSGKSVYLWSCKEVDVFYIVEIGIDIHVHVQ